MSIRTAVILSLLLALQGMSGPRVMAGSTMARLMDGEILVQEIDPDTKTFQGTGLVKAPWERVWQGLTEEPYFTRIFHENKGAVLSEQGAGYDIYCFHTRFFLLAYDYCLQRRLDRESHRITWLMTEGDFEEMEGKWELEPVADGQMTLVTFTNRVKIGSWIPESWVSRGSRNRIPRTLTALRLWGETGRFLPEE